ncbi:site-specific DNA-methyltransferase [Halomonas sp. DP5N14-9]|uniref:DNA-methyltransferase n=1 Tax=Halomonas sp. DP5N14-9 TaxID=2859075 RepID=UPI001C9900BF|nr:site-specific DNA-methyltransferase [Halomonas sp. DP5N14-9]MBY5943111.1 site-specific DNA-methyltransferase [Halomonas sp. DP5N14-9]
MSYEILHGDCMETLRTLPEQSVHCCVTSPPYFGLRDYGRDGQLGMEKTPEEFVDALVRVFREVRRVLRDDGTVWLNLGDSYGAGKQLHGMPWRVAFALQSDGWYLRQDIIWSKPNPMPESVRDRCTKAHEYVFLLSKGPRYYYDHESVKEPAAESSLARWAQDIDRQAGSDRQPGKTNGPMRAVGGPRSTRDSFRRTESKRNAVIPGQRKGTHRSDRDEGKWDRAMRNRRSVWTVSTRPYKGAHFATFPPDLIAPCVLAGCPEGGTVLDPFGGSGTTAGVAMAHKRKAILCELNADYAELVEGRVAWVLSYYGIDPNAEEQLSLLEALA